MELISNLKNSAPTPPGSYAYVHRQYVDLNNYQDKITN